MIWWWTGWQYLRPLLNTPPLAHAYRAGHGQLESRSSSQRGRSSRRNIPTLVACCSSFLLVSSTCFYHGKKFISTTKKYWLETNQNVHRRLSKTPKGFSTSTLLMIGFFNIFKKCIFFFLLLKIRWWLWRGAAYCLDMIILSRAGEWIKQYELSLIDPSTGLILLLFSPKI